MVQSSALLDVISSANWIPAVIAGVASYGVAVWKSHSDLETLKAQVAFKNEETVNSLRAKYISPLRSSALVLTRRMQEIEVKFTHAQHDEVSRWFKTVKDHVVADSRREDFQVWCYYEGTFAVSTLYYTGTYFKCVHEIYAYSPFRELDSEYSAALEQQVERVRDAFDWGNGVWGPIQDVLGQRFVGAIGETSAALLSYKDMCELLDSGDPLKFGPFLRLLDMYWSTLDLKNVQAIRMALDDLLKFIESRRIAR